MSSLVGALVVTVDVDIGKNVDARLPWLGPPCSACCALWPALVFYFLAHRPVPLIYTALPFVCQQSAFDFGCTLIVLGHIFFTIYVMHDKTPTTTSTPMVAISQVPHGDQHHKNNSRINWANELLKFKCLIQDNGKTCLI